MPKIRKSAVKLEQGGMRLFLTSFSIRDFTQDKFYRVDRLDVAEGQGMQRLLDDARTKRFRNDFIEAHKEGEALLPTSVFLATDGDIDFDEQAGEIVFDASPSACVCPFDVVDGQHRIEGLRRAAEKIDGEGLHDFPVATVIVTGLAEAERMLQFIVVNTKQEKVDDGVAQHIIARFTDMNGVTDLPYLPGWLRKKIEKGDDKRALKLVIKLNQTENSPFCGRIQMADEHRTPAHTVNQKSFVKNLTRYLLTASHPLLVIENDPDKRFRMLNNFWLAVARVCVGDYDERTSAFTASGLEFFLQIFGAVLNQLAKRGSYTADEFEECLRSAADFLVDSEYAGILSPEYWKKGGPASVLNRAGREKMAAKYCLALAQAGNHGAEIEV